MAVLIFIYGRFFVTTNEVLKSTSSYRRENITEHTNYY